MAIAKILMVSWKMRAFTVSGEVASRQRFDLGFGKIGAEQEQALRKSKAYEQKETTEWQAC
jgi:hypothetical protein